jgi:hypothetical protein
MILSIFISFISVPILITEKMKDHAGKYRKLEFKIPTKDIKFSVLQNDTIEIILTVLNL